MNEIELVTDNIETQALGPAMPLASVLPAVLPNFEDLRAVGLMIQTESNLLQQRTDLDEVEKISQLNDLEQQLLPLHQQLRLQITAAKLPALESETGVNKLVALRNVKGDGNCYYRAILQAYLENQIAHDKLDSLTELATHYQNHYDEFSKEIIFKPGQREKLVSPQQFNEFMQAIIQVESPEQRQQLLVKAFNYEDSRLDLSAVALIRHLISAEILAGQDDEFIIENANLIKQMNVFVEDASFIATSFAKQFNVEVRNISISDENRDQPCSPETINDQTKQIIVVHDGNHFFAGRTQAVQDTMVEYMLPSVKGLERSGEKFVYDNNEVTANAEEFLFLKDKSTLTNETGNDAMKTEVETKTTLTNSMQFEQDDLAQSFAKLSALLPPERNVTSIDDGVFAEADQEQAFIDELDLQNLEKHKAFKELLLTEDVLGQENNRLFISDSQKLYKLLNDWDKNDLRLAEEDSSYSSPSSDADDDSSEEQLQGLITARQGAAQSLHQGLVDAELQLEQNDQTVSATLKPQGDQQVAPVFGDEKVFSSFAREVFALNADDEIKVTQMRQGYRAESGNDNIVYDSQQRSLTVNGADPIKLLAKAIEEYARQPQFQGTNLRWELSEGVQPGDVRRYINSEVGQHIYFNDEDFSPSATLKSVTSTQDASTQTTSFDDMAMILDDKGSFYNAIGASRTMGSPNRVGAFVKEYGGDLANYLNKILNAQDHMHDIPAHVKPYLTHLLNAAISQDNDDLMVALVRNLPAKDAQNSLNAVLKNEAVDVSTKEMLANIVMENLDLTTAAHGKVWGVNQSLDNLLLLIGNDQLEGVLADKLERGLPSNAVLDTIIQQAAKKDRLELIKTVYQAMKKDDKLFLLSSDTVDALLSSQAYREKFTADQLLPTHAGQLLEAAINAKDTSKRYAIPELLEAAISKPELIDNKSNSEPLCSALRTAAKFLAAHASSETANIEFHIDEGVCSGKIGADSLAKLALILFEKQGEIVPSKKELKEFQQQIRDIVLKPQNNYVKTEDDKDAEHAADGIINKLDREKRAHQDFAKALLRYTGVENKPELVEPLANKCVFSGLRNEEQFDVMRYVTKNPVVMAAFLTKLGVYLDCQVKGELAARLVKLKDIPSATDTLIFNQQHGVLTLINSKNIRIKEDTLSTLHYIADKLAKNDLPENLSVSNGEILTLTNGIINSTLSVDQKIDLVKKLVDLPANEDNVENIQGLLKAKQDEISGHVRHQGGKVVPEVLQLLKSFDGVATMAVWLVQKAVEGDRAPKASAARAILALHNYGKALEGRWKLTDDSRYKTVHGISNMALNIFTTPGVDMNANERANQLQSEITGVFRGKLRTELDNAERPLVVPSA